MEHKVIVYKKIDPQVLDYLRTMCQVVYFEELNEYTYPQFKTHLQDTHALLGSGLKVDDALLAQSPQLKVVSNVSVGYDNLNLPLLTKRNIVATNTPGVLNETVADAMFGLLLSAARRIPELDAYVKQGDWNQQLGEAVIRNGCSRKSDWNCGNGRHWESNCSTGEIWIWYGDPLS